MVIELTQGNGAVAAAVGALGGAASCWPDRIGVRRLGALFATPRRVARLAMPRPRRGALLAVAAALGALTAGPAGGAAAAIAVGVASRRIRATRAGRRRTAAVDGLLDALGSLVGELRAGAHPAAAADSTRSTDETVGQVFTAIAATARLGGDLPTRLRALAATMVELRDALGRMASAWSLADRHGIALAELLDAVRGDLDLRRRFAARIRAQLAGPRATAAVLAGLPLLGVILGQGIGAEPWQVLTGTAAGQLLLLGGVTLVAAGALWNARIVSAAEPR